MIYGIPSYGRTQCKTVRALLDCGVKKEQIIISTQTRNDYENYKKLHDVHVIFKENNCASGNRNALLDYVKDSMFLVDDDITYFCKYDGRRFIKSFDVIDELNEQIRRAIFGPVSLIGVSATDSNFVRKRRAADHDVLSLLQGSLLYVADKDLRFNEDYKMVEDYELSLRVLRAGGVTVRLNNYSCRKPKNGTNPGGLNQRYRNGELRFWVEKLHREYREFVPNSAMTGGTIRR